MAEIDETRFNNLENRVTKLEEYIMRGEETEKKQQKTGTDKKLEDIKTSIDKSDKKSDAIIGMNFGVIAMILALSFMPPQSNICIACSLYAVGFLAFLVSLLRLRQSKKPKSNS